MTESSPTLFELFGSETDLTDWEGRIKQGDLPSRDQLKAILLANREQSLPEWLLEVVILGLEGKLKGTRGRRRETSLAAMRWALAKAKYEETLLWLQRREKSSRLRGWKILRGKDWWNGPPHERAARIVIARLGLRIDWRAFLNRISSDKSGDLL